MKPLPAPALSFFGLRSARLPGRHGCPLTGVLLGGLLGAMPAPGLAQTISFAQTPLFLGTTVKPNLLVVYDNSQSMDGTMSGKLIAGNDPSTRGNVARSVLRNTIASYRNSFNWGLASFAVSNVSYRTTYPYYFGQDADMVYTNDCVAGISASNGSRRCIANPQPGNGYTSLTYAHSSDDAWINDVLYTSDLGGQIYGVGVTSSTNYKVYLNRASGAGLGWVDASFGSYQGNWGFTPTDAGYLPGWPDRRMVFVKRAWGYLGDISGMGSINQVVAADSTTQYNALMALLANETSSTTSGELKNAAVFTPLAGALATAKSYFGNSISGKPSPISLSCQRNFVVLATDGNPTAKTSGGMYSTAQMTNTEGVPGVWAFGQAATDVFANVTALRSTLYNSVNYDVQTYVIGLGDSVNNRSSLATLNRIADLGGTSGAYLATDTAALADAFQRISVDIVSRTAAASSVSLNSGSWSTGAKVYQGRFSSADWSGQLLAFPLSNNGTPSSTADWDAGQRVNLQHWSTGRQIMSYKPSAALGSRGVAFRWPALATAPTATEIDLDVVAALNKNSVGSTDGYGSQRVEYLRGNTARESATCSGCAAPVFRSRPISRLGDIVNSAPTYVGGALGDYRDTMEVSRYSSYAASRGSRTPVIYVGANDGMLHAFNAANGNELMAYVPYAVRSRLSTLTADPMIHAYTVDGSPSVGDVYYGGGWKTLLVSGMNAGARGLFALDVSDPTLFTEANAARVVRWEIGDSDADMGHVFGKPILVKTRDGRWRAITGNGYNSNSGKAMLMLVDLETGAITRIDTGVGSAALPNGLSAVTVASTNDNGVGDIVYAGDLRGNLWKFDLSSTLASGWKVAYGTTAAPLPLFTSAAGQAITARPDVTRTPKGGFMVALGTGRYLDVGDNVTTASQSLYGIWDNGSTVALADLQSQSVFAVRTGANGNNYRFTTHAVGVPGDTLITGDNAISVASYYGSKKGWRMSLPTSGERVVTEATVRAGRLVISTLIPSTTACSFGGDGWIMDVDVATGNRAPALDTNGDNLVDSNDLVGGNMMSGVRVGAVPAAATIMRSFTKSLDDKLINTSAGTILRVREAGTSTTSRRAAWEQLQ